MHRFPACLAVTLAAAPALAQDRPPLIPTRDVSIAYRTTAAPPGVPSGATMRMSWLVAEQKLRVDMPGGVGWSLVDQRSQKMVMVMERQRMIMDLPIEGGPGGLSIPSQAPDSARFTRAGTATIAGLACTLWRYEDTAGRGEACVTADGVILRSSGTHGGQTGTLEATEVAYGAQDPARFRIPSGYQSMQIPGMATPSAPPGAARPPAR
ncbi:MAG: hypothetical protein JWP04_2360 [Belnapia sp.]|jgi:hypothetical protein|nr:hypothetical protein [Belnapia sp.]